MCHGLICYEDLPRHIAQVSMPSADMCLDMCIEVGTDMCVDMCVDVGIDMSIGTCVDVGIDMCVGMCRPMLGHVC